MKNLHYLFNIPVYAIRLSCSAVVDSICEKIMQLNLIATSFSASIVLQEEMFNHCNID
jgi:hypothetical protein